MYHKYKCVYTKYDYLYTTLKLHLVTKTNIYHELRMQHETNFQKTLYYGELNKFNKLFKTLY